MNTRRTLARWIVTSMCAATPMTIHAGEPEKKEAVEKKGAIRVVVVVILATKDNNVVDKKLASLAKEMEKRGSEFTGFKIHSVLSESIVIGKSNMFDLLEDQTLKVAIDKLKDDKNRVGLTITPSEGKELAYSCVCETFFPVLTGHKTKDGFNVIVAVSAKPCTGKGP